MAKQKGKEMKKKDTTKTKMSPLKQGGNKQFKKK